MFQYKPGFSTDIGVKPQRRASEMVYDHREPLASYITVPSELATTDAGCADKHVSGTWPMGWRAAIG